MIKYIKSNYSVFVTLVVYTLILLPFLDTSRSVFVDEAWYSNSSYNLIRLHSFVNTNIGYGGNGLVVYMLYLVAYFGLFGAGLFVARFSSFVMGVIAIFILKKMLRILNVSEFNSLLALTFLMFANLYLLIFKFVRPESLTFVLALCFLLVLYNYVKSDFHIKYLLLVMLLMFLMINSHPSSSTIIFLLFLLVPYFMYKNARIKKIYQLVILVAWGVFCVYFLVVAISFNNSMNMSESYSILSQRNTVNSSFLEGIYLKLASTYLYFFNKRIITFLPHLLVLLVGLFYYRKNKMVFLLALCGIVSMLFAIFTISALAFHFIYVYVFLFSALVLPLILEMLKGKKKMRRVAEIVVVFVILLNVVAFAVFSRENYDPEINKKAKEINSLILPNSTVVTAPSFWFIAPERDFKAWEYYKNRNEVLSEKVFYIINSDKFSKINESDGNSIANLRYEKDGYKMDTLYSTFSKIYGNIDLIKLTSIK